MRIRGIAVIVAILFIMGLTVPVMAASANASLRKGIEYYKSGDLAAATAEVQKAVEIDADNASARSWLGFLLL
ncbi:MAG TPA: tetratricopeptide repeat protein, partial [Armatimonadota bacterium]|nr:tetratricopeptide repeat protein [Armatimonadota bacterium]